MDKTGLNTFSGLYVFDAHPEMISCIADIQHAFYINLEKRADRRTHVENELKKIGIPAMRFNAIRLENGALGCSMSHLKCIQHAKEQNWSHVLVCEDDIQFLDPELFKRQLNAFLKNHTDDWDVVLLAGNNMPPFQQIDDTCVKVSQCQTTTGYIVKQHYYDTLIDNFKLGIQLLIREPQKHIIYAIDKNWFYLQQSGRWYLIIPLTVVQKTDYSDIEKRIVNYKRIMTDLDKHFLIRQIQDRHK
jgi:GR25 family glycosyltransferase involved in LPS biosynthesis